ncbi:serine/arginine repetitive matrix protein 1-like [Dermacentor albipictus]|uniref:serine/arginine repetitive matrix protein 1-like n=1 Tax=Dermacentor albipictus TaxID=60249 RepID=UPI0038FC9D0B
MDLAQQDTSRFLSVPQLPQHPSPQGTRDPNRIMSDPVDRRCTKSPWTATTLPNRTQMPNQVLQLPVARALSPHFPTPRTGRKKMAPKTMAHRYKRSRSRPSSRLKRRSASPPPKLPSKIRETSSDDSVMTKSAMRLLPKLNKKQPSPARSRKAMTRSKAAPAIAVARKPRSDRTATSRDFRWDARPPSRHAVLSPSPHYKTMPQPMCHSTGKRTCPVDSVRTASDSRHDALSPFSQVAPDSDVSGRTIPIVNQMALPSVSSPDAEPGPLCSSDSEKLHFRTTDSKLPPPPLPLESGLRNLNSSGKPSGQAGSRPPPNVGVPAQRVPVPAGTLRNHARRPNDVGRILARRSSASSISESSDGGELSDVPASSSRATHTACATVCLATAAVLSFLACYAITAAVMAASASGDHRADPITARPEEESELGYPRDTRRYIHGPQLATQKALSSNRTLPSQHAEGSQGNSSNDGNVTDAFELTVKPNNKI